MQTNEMGELNAGTLWERFHGELLAFLRTRVNGDADARDILQSTYMRAHEHLRSGERPENPRAWLYRIVRNLIIDAHRRNQRQLALTEAIANEPAPENLPPSLEADAFAVVARSLPMFIEELDAPYRDALRMTELEGLTQAEAAERAGISVSGMKSRVQRGRARVFDSLHRCCVFELDVRGHMIACTDRRHVETCC